MCRQFQAIWDLTAVSLIGFSGRKNCWAWQSWAGDDVKGTFDNFHLPEGNYQLVLSMNWACRTPVPVNCASTQHRHHPGMPLPLRRNTGEEQGCLSVALAEDLAFILSTDHLALSALHSLYFILPFITGCLILVHFTLHWIYQCWITLVMEFSSDHTRNSVLALSCLGQHKECGEVPILSIPGSFGVGEVLIYSGLKVRPDTALSSGCCSALTKLKNSHLSSCFVSCLLALNL